MPSSIERLLGLIDKVQNIGALPDLTAKTLAEKIGDIGLVVDGHAHAALPGAVACWRHGRRAVNSVNSPGSLSTLIMPPCCDVTMSTRRRPFATMIPSRRSSTIRASPPGSGPAT
jgi:hypothetical protein